MRFNKISAALAVVLLATSGLAWALPQATAGKAEAGSDARQNRLATLDGNRDGFVTRAEAAEDARLTARFDTLDSNKDGRLSNEELRASRQGDGRRGGGKGRGRGGEHHGAERTGGGPMRGLQGLDKNGDGRISQAEAAADARLAARFAELDVNRDGQLDQADRQARRQQRLAERFAAADSDKDGKLSRAEFEAMHAARDTGPRGERR